jgi:hypothetical protein
VANEVTTTILADSTFAAWVTDNILDEARPYMPSKPFWRYAGPQKSNAYQFPIQDKPAVAAAYTEGTGLSNAAFTDSKATATAGPVGQQATVTDEAEETTVYDAVGQITSVLGRSMGEKFETDCCTFYDDFSNTSNTAGVALSYVTMLGAINALEGRDMSGQVVAVLDTSQVGDIRKDVGSSGAALFGHGDMNIAGMVASTLSGYSGFSIGPCPIYQTSLVTATGGAVFMVDEALGLYEIRQPRTETIRVPGLPGLQIDLTARYGQIEIRDASGQTVLI